MAVSLSIIPSLSFSSRHFPSKPYKRFVDKVQSFKRHKELENGGGNCANNYTLVFNQVYRSGILPDINFGGKKVTLLNKEDNVGPIRRVNVVLVDTKAYQLTECTLDSIGGITLEIKAAGSTYGTFFRVTTFGESHGAGVGCVIDGCPPRLPLSEADIQLQLDRRRPGQNRGTTPREEADACQISSGIADGLTTGSPIKIEVPNTNTRGRDYNELSKAYRPSHADATYDFKYGLRSIEGGGRSSARETIGRVAAGAIAKKILKQFSGTEVLAYTSRVHKVVLTEDLVDYDTLTLDQIESNIARCPNPEYAEKMIAAIDAVRESGDSAGGIVTCIVRNVPRGLGSPVFDKLEAELAKAVLSVPASTGFEFGSGFAGSSMIGSEHNDEFYIDENGRIRTITNRSGGIQGGISNGETISMKIAFKPTPTINKKQKTVTRDKHETELIFLGRQEPCIAPRAVPVVEAMVAMVLVDQLMAQYAQCMLFPINPTLQEPIGPLRTEILN